MLQKIGRWGAARLQGTKGKQKYDDWMKRNPWASTALKAGDMALMAYGAPKLVGGLKGLLGVEKGAGVAARAGAFRTGAQQAASGFTRKGIGEALRGAGELTGRGLGAAFNYAKANPLPTAMGLEALLSAQQAAQQNQMARDEFRMEQERQQQLAKLLMPLFAAQFSQRG